MRLTDLPNRMADKIMPTPDGCWLWTASTNWGGYGRISLNRRYLMAHRVVYEALVGPIPEGLDIDHLCRQKLCVNPAHLEPVTHRENMLRGTSPAATRAKQTHCVNGHDLTDAYIVPGRGVRHCRTCRRLRMRRYRNRDDA